MSVRNRTGVIYLEGRDNNRYMTLTTLELRFTRSLYIQRPIGFEPIFADSKSEVLAIILRATYYVNP